MEMGRGVARRVSRRQQIDFVPSPVLNSKPTTFAHLGPHRLGRNFLFLATASFDWLLSFTRSTCQSERRDGPVISFVSNLLADCTYTKRCQLLDNFVKGLLFSSLFFYIFISLSSFCTLHFGCLVLSSRAALHLIFLLCLSLFLRVEYR